MLWENQGEDVGEGKGEEGCNPGFANKGCGPSQPLDIFLSHFLAMPSVKAIIDHQGRAKGGGKEKSIISIRMINPSASRRGV